MYIRYENSLNDYRLMKVVEPQGDPRGALTTTNSIACCAAACSDRTSHLVQGTTLLTA